MNFKVTLQMDGTGVYYDPFEPPTLDGMLAWILAPMQGVQKALSRDDTPDDIRLPLLRSTLHGSQVWHASFLFPEGATAETLHYWRKKFRQNRIELTEGSPNLTNGAYREYNMPFPELLTHRLIAYASGDCGEVKRLLKRHIAGVGKKRAYGKGRIVDVDCEHTDADYSLVKDGKAMRYLPSPNGSRRVRTAPPYWNNVHRVPCCEVGDQYTEELLSS